MGECTTLSIPRVVLDHKRDAMRLQKGLEPGDLPEEHPAG